MGYIISTSIVFVMDSLGSIYATLMVFCRRSLVRIETKIRR